MARKDDRCPATGKSYSLEPMRRDILTDPFFGEAVRFVLERIGDLREKKIVDIGCGSGRMSVFFALAGARVIGIDKKSSALEESRRLARLCAVEGRCLFLLGTAESLPVGAATTDLAFSRSALQYMDRKWVLPGYARIVKPSGDLVLIENLSHNPFINFYRLRRRLFPTTSSDLEHVKSVRTYITPAEVENLDRYFQVVEHDEFHFIRMFSIYLCRHFGGGIAGTIDRVFHRIDRAVFRLFPFLRRFAWFTAVYCTGKRHV